jgi:hypothetical protein
MFNNSTPTPPHLRENRMFYGLMSKNMVEPEESQITSQYGAHESHAG